MAENTINEPYIKVLIVDDEQLVRKGLRLTTDWTKHQMIVVDDAPNGCVGWDKFLEHRPHVVITDIVMPEMGGIEFAQKVRKEAPDTKILFLSCHRDFDYAKQGIQIGITDYIVKTSLDEQKLDQCLDLLHQEIDKQLAKRADAVPYPPTVEHSELAGWLLDKKQTARNQFMQRLEKEWKWMTSEGYIFHIFLEGDSPSKRSEVVSELFLPMTDQQDMLLLQSGEENYFLICCSQGLQACSEELLRSKINNGSIGWRQAGPIMSPDQWMSSVHRLHRLRHIEQELELANDAHKEDILNAIDYIDLHLHQDLRAAEIASKIGVSRSYFSTIFKEATGSSLISFISDRKLERAKALLRSTSFRADEIAEKVGINDAKYFSKWFKKSASLTPGQYRLQTK
ncbi:response regulator transcription factor [Paenibacillus planticolens]|uniref:Response regulator n=1 Tax=Paenibacillus planticolens TaxID=2654976 RepID=A0ABX1ZLZ1_9BACL|nr:response regulator [Paenibacillus planticolens]NOV01105.1 response regulator [Paenibacillus planticolens]